MSYEARKVRRRLIADDVAAAFKNGTELTAVEDAMKKYGCAIYLVKRSLKEHGVPTPRRKPSPRFMGKTLRILARLLMPQLRETFTTIARDLRISVQRVSQVFNEAQEVGFKMHKWQAARPGVTRRPRTIGAVTPHKEQRVGHD